MAGNMTVIRLPANSRIRSNAGLLERLACVAVLSGVEALINPMPVHAKAR